MILPTRKVRCALALLTVTLACKTYEAPPPSMKDKATIIIQTNTNPSIVSYSMRIINSKDQNVAISRKIPNNGAKFQEFLTSGNYQLSLSARDKNNQQLFSSESCPVSDKTGNTQNLNGGQIYTNTIIVCDDSGNRVSYDLKKGDNQGATTAKSNSDGTIYKSSATSFSAMGVGFGGRGSCGLSFDDLVKKHQNPNFVALVGGSGMFKNRANCFRTIRVTMGGKCSGGLTRGECRGTLNQDQYAGATLDFIVADECPPFGNPPCAADPNHLDLSRSSLQSFTKEGQKLPLNDNVISQRQILWKFLP